MPATLRTFDETDWHAFAGCESAEPQIADLGRTTLIVDGSVLTAIRTSAFGTTERFGDHGTHEDALAAANELVECFNRWGHGIELNSLVRCYAANIR